MRHLNTFLTVLALAAPQLHAAIQVQLRASLTSPQPLGTAIIWTAAAVDSNPNPVTYKFESTSAGSTSFSLLRDFSLAANFGTAPSFTEGTFQIRVTARDYLTGETAQQTASFTVTTRVQNNQPAVNTTAHPLVALFSAPTCPAGSSMRVAFQLLGASYVSHTDFRPCHAGSMNFYVAGMSANLVYQMHYEVRTGTTIVPSATVLSFRTGSLPAMQFPQGTVLVPPTVKSAISYPILLTGYAPEPGLSLNFPVATALGGSILWYYLDSVMLTRPLTGGTMLLIANGKGTGTGVYGTTTQQEVLREIDLAGNLLRETNSDRISEQLVARGSDPICRFHHDAIRLANGNTIVFGNPQRVYPAGTQGATTPVDLIGLTIVVLDRNWQVIWHWNAFDHAGGGTQLDINRAAVRGEVCTSDGSHQGCPPVLLSSPANDWLHANSVQYLTSDGNLLVSLRNQDWVIKIDYSNGAGTGNILWRLGQGGDFAMNSSDPYPWFSGQHDAAFEDGGASVLSVFDNGNSRVQQYSGGNSRGQVLRVDQVNRTASLTLNSDLGVFAFAVGSAQLLPNGNYTFQPGWIQVQTNAYEQSIEVASDTSVVYKYQGQSVSYRSWRMPDLYSPPAS